MAYPDSPLGRVMATLDERKRTITNSAAGADVVAPEQAAMVTADEAQTRLLYGDLLDPGDFQMVNDLATPYAAMFMGAISAGMGQPGPFLAGLWLDGLGAGGLLERNRHAAPAAPTTGQRIRIDLSKTGGPVGIYRVADVDDAGALTLEPEATDG